MDVLKDDVEKVTNTGHTIKRFDNSSLGLI